MLSYAGTGILVGDSITSDVEPVSSRIHLGFWFWNPGLTLTKRMHGIFGVVHDIIIHGTDF